MHAAQVERLNYDTKQSYINTRYNNWLKAFKLLGHAAYLHPADFSF